MSESCCDFDGGFGGAGGASPGAGGINGLVVEDEGVPIAGTPFTTLDFIGGGVAATDAGGGTAAITVPGITFQDEGVAVAGAPHTIANFTGEGVAATNGGAGVVTITIPTNPFSPPEQWFRTDVPAGITEEEMAAAVSPYFTTIKMMRAGSIVGLCTRLTETLTGLGILGVEVFINDVATGMLLEHNSGVNPDGGVLLAAPGTVTYAADDLIGLRISTEAIDFGPTTTDIVAWIECVEAI